MKNIIDMWTDEKRLEEIKSYLKSKAPGLTNGEFLSIKELCLATGLNPYLKEVWVIKRGNDNQIMIGRDGYRKGAQRQPEYDYHYVEAIYSNDIFEVVNGEVQHRHAFLKRGELVGAYCVAKRKSSSRAIHATASITEYDKKQSLWNTMKETMIKKVAEANALRLVFQEVFSGTYSDAELYEEEAPKVTQTDILKDKITENKNVENKNIIFPPCTEEQKQIIEILLEETQFSDENITKVCDYFKVQEWTQLNTDCANKFIARLKKEGGK